MTGKLTVLVVLWVGVILNSIPGVAQPRPPSQPRPTSAQTAPANRLYQRHDTWYEFLLKQFNPDGVDYGQWIGRERHALIEARLKNPYFLYSLSTTVGLLVMAVVCAKVRIDHRRAMWITAEMMADIYNQDAYSRKVAQEAINRYNTHIERCNRAIEAAEHGDPIADKGSEIEQLKGELACIASERDTATRERDLAREELRKKAEILADMSVRLDALTGKSGAATKSTTGVHAADPMLVTHINNLQEQLYAERTNNRRLKGG